LSGILPRDSLMVHVLATQIATSSCNVTSWQTHVEFVGAHADVSSPATRHVSWHHVSYCASLLDLDGTYCT
jgi:hypothetical protein